MVMANVARKSQAAACLKNLAGVAGKSLEWLWDRVVPRGKLTLITGESGAGKSLFVLDVVAAVTNGQVGPGELDSSQDPFLMGNGVLLLAAGDGLEDTVVPRLTAAKADMSQVFTLSSDNASRYADKVEAGNIGQTPWRFQLNRDLHLLEAELRQLDDRGVEVRLIVIDPIDRYLPTPFRKADYTAVVNRLTELAEAWNAAVIVVANSKPSRVGESGLRTGTVGNPILAQAARSVWMVAKDLEIDQRRLLIPLKTNLCQTPQAMAFSIRDGVLDWSPERMTISGDDYFSQSKEKLRNPLFREEVSEVSRVTNWLRDKLQHGPVASVTIRRDAVDHDIAYSTLRRAFHRLACVSEKTWLDQDWRWIWRMPGNPESRCGYLYETMMTSEDVFREIAAQAAEESVGSTERLPFGVGMIGTDSGASPACREASRPHANDNCWQDALS